MLRQTLSRLRKPERAPRVAVVGIGNELRADDAAGLLIARALIERQTGSEAQSSILALNAGAAPENVTGALRRFAPDLVIFADAAFVDEGTPAGAVHWLDWRETAGLSASTHTLPLHVIAQYLVSELGCEVVLIGIQADGIAFDQAMSPAIQQTAQAVAAELWTILTETHP
ncbi:MAG: hydrogenase 3 maturation endopeptidase HyCI [Anaerolineae bacterium]|uniref:hydrogenase 3 maturation endopeptidase HyCI n=1 Tax=Candidatus Roseilinea sp. TaxID=2838777 RepID=UPI00404B11A9